MIIDEKTYLEHYGVKGMRWGVRNRRKSDKKRNKNRSRNIAIGVGGGAAGLVGAYFLRKHFKKRTPMKKALSSEQARHVRSLLTKTNRQSKEFEVFKVSMDKTYFSLSKDLRRAERAMDPKFIKDRSVYQWPSSFTGRS